MKAETGLSLKWRGRSINQQELNLRKKNDAMMSYIIRLGVLSDLDIDALVCIVNRPIFAIKVVLARARRNYSHLFIYPCYGQ